MKRLPMRKIRDVLRLSAEGLSTRQMAASLAIGRTELCRNLGDGVIRRAAYCGGCQSQPGPHKEQYAYEERYNHPAVSPIGNDY